MNTSCYKQSLIGFDQKSWFDPRLISSRFMAFWLPIGKGTGVVVGTVRLDRSFLH